MKRGQLNLMNIMFLGIAFFFLFPIITMMQAGIDTWPTGANPYVDTLFRLAPALLILGFIAIFNYFVFPRRAA